MILFDTLHTDIKLTKTAFTIYSKGMLTDEASIAASTAGTQERI